MGQAKVEKEQQGIAGQDWQSIIEKLKAKQKSLQPGDKDILDIAAVIQSIEGDALGENFGHARYFLVDPSAKRQALADIKKAVFRYVPELKKAKKQV